jgi:Noc2p family
MQASRLVLTENDTASDKLLRFVQRSRTWVVGHCAQGVYRAYVANSRNMTMEGAATLGLMRRCCVELYGIDAEASYEHAFTYLRQLAVLLRGALAAKTRDAFREVYCWQTVNSLDLWASLVSAHADSPVPTQQLMYPVPALLYVARFHVGPCGSMCQSWFILTLR